MPRLMPSDITGTEILEESEDGHPSLSFCARAGFRQPDFSPTKSTARRPKRRPPCSKPCRNAASPSPGTAMICRRRFFVMATQNPIEQEGTYPVARGAVGPLHVQPARELSVARRRGADSAHDDRDELAPLEKIWTGEELLALQSAVRQVPVPETVAHYAVALVQSTRPEGGTAPDFIQRYVQWGAGPRAVAISRAGGKSLCRARRPVQRCPRRHPAAAKLSCATASSPTIAPRPTNKPWTRSLTGCWKR